MDQQALQQDKKEAETTNPSELPPKQQEKYLLEEIDEQLTERGK